MTIETKELKISNELKRKVEMICKFAYVEYSFTNGSIISLKNTNIAYVKPHILKVKDNDYLIFEDSENVFINGYNNKIKFKDLETLIRNIHKRKPSYGYHRINYLIRKETGCVVSDNLVHKVCKILKIK